jgi:hypothetical protein
MFSCAMPDDDEAEGPPPLDSPEPLELSYEITDLKALGLYLAGLEKPPSEFIEALRRSGERLMRAGVSVRGTIRRRRFVVVVLPDDDPFVLPEPPEPPPDPLFVVTRPARQSSLGKPRSSDSRSSPRSTLRRTRPWSASPSPKRPSNRS